MISPTITCRDISKKELDLVHRGFNQHTIDSGVEIQTADRFTYVLECGEEFHGCSSGLAYKHGEKYSPWFYLTDLIVFPEYRKQGYGAQLLTLLEKHVIAKNIKHIWTWTAGYEAPGFYKKQGYEIFMSMEEWYSDGSPRIGLKKILF